MVSRSAGGRRHDRAVRTIPGVESAGLVTHLPLAGDPSSGATWRADAPGASGTKLPASVRDQWRADISVVTPGYFQTLGIRFLNGRNFSEADRFSAEQLANPATPRAGVAIINSVFAARFFPNDEAIGKTLVLFDDQTFGRTRTIIAVVADTRVRGRRRPRATIDFPAARAVPECAPTNHCRAFFVAT